MKYKFKIETKVPSADKIDKHKDFKRLRANYDEAVKPLYKKPLYKDKRALLVILVILLLSWVIFELVDQEDKENQKTNTQTAK